jgi:hypothetical protein
MAMGGQWNHAEIASTISSDGGTTNAHPVVDFLVLDVPDRPCPVTDVAQCLGRRGREAVGSPD